MIYPCSHTIIRIASCLALLLLAAPLHAAIQWTASPNTLEVSTPTYRLVMDAHTGAPKELFLNGQPALSFGPAGWWRITFEKGEPLRAQDCTARISHTADELSAIYTSPRAEVRLRFHFGEAQFDIHAQVHAIGSVVTRIALPEEVRFSSDALKECYFPQELGLGLTRSFFAPQPEDRPAHWSRESIGAAGAAAVGIHPTEMRDYNEPAVPVRVTPAGEEWLGGAGDLNGWKVRSPRPPAVTPALTLLETSSGPLLSLERVDGGWGWFVRWGGVFEGADRDRARTVSALALAALWQRPVTSGPKVPAPAALVGHPRREVMPAVIGIISLDNGQGAEPWRAALAPLGCAIRLLHTPDEILKSLQAHDCWLIVNPDNELLPAPAAQQDAMSLAIRSYITDGGVWLHTGSAPFFYRLQAEPFLSISSAYPPAFADFMNLNLDLGSISLYGVRDPAAIFVPSELSAGGAPEGGRLSREWITWVDDGKTWDAPIARFVIGPEAPSAIRQYAAENGFTRTLQEKVKPDVLARLKQSLLLKYSGPSFREEAQKAPLLPQPALIHVSDYLHGGFDKQYPDHLPPAPWMGTPAEFSALIGAVHGAGSLFMPYTNPTWWCDHPPGPTFLREGDAPLLKDREGKPVREVYGQNDGWSLTAFHPAAIAAEKTILRQFTQDYPSDVLFQDQIGARSPTYDFNPASPTPYAYTQGMLDIARRDSASVPLGTENGFDAAMNSETLFCGLCWNIIPTEHGPDWRSLWRDTLPAGTWRLAPLALWEGHDRTIFTMHDLGQFVTNREVLAWTLLLGYKLSATTDAGSVGVGENWQWIKWLAALQKTIGPHLDGAPLTGWAHPAAGVYASQWNGLHITANTTPLPYRLDAMTTLSPYGFYITGEGISAGWLDRYRGHAYPDGFAFVGTGSQLSVYAPEGGALTLPDSRGVRLEGAALPSRMTAAGLEVTLPSVTPVVSIPPALQALAPHDRPTPPQIIGVIDIPWMTYGWASTRAEDWENGLGPALADLHLTVKPLRSWADLAAALQDPTHVLSIVNPYGEHFPEAGAGRSQGALSAIRTYCAHGGAWFETSAYSFYNAIYPTAGGAAGMDATGAGGLASLGYHVVDLGNNPPPVPLKVTAAGQEWLGPALSAAIGKASALVNRPFAAGESSLELVSGGSNGFVSGVRVGGWGWLWRLGGSDPPKELSIPLVAGILRHLDTTPPVPVPPSQKRRLYGLEVG